MIVIKLKHVSSSDGSVSFDFKFYCLLNMESKIRILLLDAVGSMDF